VLFNTLAYAKFFAVVFVACWVLVNRRWAPLLPWLAVAIYGASQRPTPLILGVGALSLVLSAALCTRHREDRPPPPSVAGASVLINVAALSFFTYRDHGVDPLIHVLRAFGVPLGTTPLWTVPGLLISLALGYALVRARKVRLLFLLAASYVFYAHWDWRFLPLIWGSSTADWLLGNAIGRAADPRRRKLWLIGTVVVNLGVLATFKYLNFGIDSARAALASLGVQTPPFALEVALPVGISFFTFESMSYVIDVYRRQIEPQKSYLEYLSFVAFFPHLVAGPIVRPRDLLPQLAGPPRWSSQEGSEALFLIALGLLKKVAIGDYLALNLVDRVFDAPAQYSALECYAGVLGYAVQIYCDFSGYTDIAIGSALLLGVRFPLNFDAPYKASSIVDFWRRWHISLSTWLRDYLYIPLGGSRKGPARTYLNLMITMLLGGLWHGANWTFVAWGGLHGSALALTRAYQSFRAKRGRAKSRSPVVHVLCVLLTFHLVCAAWIFFRAETFQRAWSMFEQLSTFTTHHQNLDPRVIAVLAIGLFGHWAPERWYTGARELYARLPAPAQGVALFCAALGLRQMASAEAVPFVYFQF
jgi:D-alanyl-lipoteichoic acid acyltransferase DltB (MBOAT superfamily)